MFAGEEVFRNKKGVHNSYKSPDSVNAIDWTLKHVNADQFNYYKELIKLRKSHPAFRMTTAEDVARHIKFDKTDKDNLVSYSIVGNANGDDWKEIKLVFNGSDDDVDIKLPKGDWLVVARDGRLSAEGLRDAAGNVQRVRGGVTKVPHRSALILAKEK